MAFAISRSCRRRLGEVGVGGGHDDYDSRKAVLKIVLLGVSEEWRCFYGII